MTKLCKIRNRSHGAIVVLQTATIKWEKMLPQTTYSDINRHK